MKVLPHKQFDDIFLGALSSGGNFSEYTLFDIQFAQPLVWIHKVLICNYCSINEKLYEEEIYKYDINCPDLVRAFLILKNIFMN